MRAYLAGQRHLYTGEHLKWIIHNCDSSILCYINYYHSSLGKIASTNLKVCKTFS